MTEDERLILLELADYHFRHSPGAATNAFCAAMDRIRRPTPTEAAPAPPARPAREADAGDVERLVKIGEETWRMTPGTATHAFRAVAEAIARAVLSATGPSSEDADAENDPSSDDLRLMTSALSVAVQKHGWGPEVARTAYRFATSSRAALASAPAGVALPEGLRERLPALHIMATWCNQGWSDTLTNEHLRALHELIQWSERFPTTPAADTGPDPEAMEIAGRLPPDGVPRRHWTKGNRAAWTDAAAYVRRKAGVA